MASFIEMLEDRWDKGGRVCVGLDPDPKKVPEHLRRRDGYADVLKFNSEIVKATKDRTLAYKPNTAFYTGTHDTDARAALRNTVAMIRTTAPDVPVILDYKRADIDKTNTGYVEEAFTTFRADAATVNPYLGMEAMQPFLEMREKGIVVLCRTSNKGAREFQDLDVLLPVREARAWVTRYRMKFYEYVAHRVAREWNVNGNCLLVVGATAPEQLASVRRIVGDMWLLLPGIGTQGGDLEMTLRNGGNSRKRGIIINSSSDIIHASSDKDFAEVAGLETQRLAFQIDRILGSL